MTRIKRALPMALIFFALSAINIFGASNLVLTSNSTSGSPGVTYRVYTDVTRTGETTAEVKYTIKSTPNGNDSCTGITGYLSVGNDRRAISLKSASTTWYSGSTYTSNGSYTITVKPKDSVLATAFEASGSGSYQTSYQYYTESTEPTGYTAYLWKVKYYITHGGGVVQKARTTDNYHYYQSGAVNEIKEYVKDNKQTWASLISANRTGYTKFVQTGTKTVKHGPYTGYTTHYTYTGTMVKRSGYNVEIDKWYYVTYDASGGTGAPAKTGKIGKNPSFYDK